MGKKGRNRNRPRELNDFDIAQEEYARNHNQGAARADEVSVNHNDDIKASQEAFAAQAEMDDEIQALQNSLAEMPAETKEVVISKSAKEEVKDVEDEPDENLVSSEEPEKVEEVASKSAPAKNFKKSKGNKEKDTATIAELTSNGNYVKRLIKNNGVDYSVRNAMVRYGLLTKTFNEKGVPEYHGDMAACTLEEGRVDFVWNKKSYTLRTSDFFSCFSLHSNRPVLKQGIEKGTLEKMLMKAGKIESLRFALLVRNFPRLASDYDVAMRAMLQHMACFNIKEDDMLVRLADNGVVFEEE
jgi:hypothetical protein